MNYATTWCAYIPFPCCCCALVTFPPLSPLPPPLYNKQQLWRSGTLPHVCGCHYDSSSVLDVLSPQYTRRRRWRWRLGPMILPFFLAVVRIMKHVGNIVNTMYSLSGPFLLECISFFPSLHPCPIAEKTSIPVTVWNVINKAEAGRCSFWADKHNTDMSRTYKLQHPGHCSGEICIIFWI